VRMASKPVLNTKALGARNVRFVPGSRAAMRIPVDADPRMYLERPLASLGMTTWEVAGSRRANALRVAGLMKMHGAAGESADDPRHCGRAKVDIPRANMR
jgi:hypothetical protein